MPSESLQLLKRLKVGSYENCVIVTYNADLLFYEKVVLPILRSQGCYNNLVIMDLNQYGGSLLSANGLTELGKSYSVWPARAAGAFHPKLIFQTGDGGGRLILGSGNLTVRGFSSSWELFCEVTRQKERTNDHLFQQAWEFIKTAATSAAPATQQQLTQLVETSPWLLDETEPLDWPRLLTAQPGRPSLVTQFKEAVGEILVERLIVVAPFFDANLRGIRELTTAFQPKEVRLIVQASTVSLPGGEAAKLENVIVSEFAAPQRDKSAESYLHAKTYILETAQADFCLWGSPNCSAAALVAPHNIELAIVQRGKRGEFVKTLNLADSLSSSQCFDPGHLTVRTMDDADRTGLLRILSAEVRGDRIVIQLDDVGRFHDIRVGRLSLSAKGRILSEVDAERIDNGAFTATVAFPATEDVILCRLLLTVDGSAVTSTPAAIHFPHAIAQATPSRRSADLHRLTAAIQSGSLDWAKGLHQVCELIFKIDRSSGGGIQAARTFARTKRARDNNSPNEADQVQAYEDFVGEGTLSLKQRATTASTFLGDILNALTSQLRVSHHDADADSESNDADAWKYQEEVDSGSAEAGEPQTQNLIDIDDTMRAVVKLRRGYRNIMENLTARCESRRDGNELADADEFWRLGAVNHLLLNGCQRDVAQHPVLLPHDIVSYYLPAAAVMLGRAGPLRAQDSNNGLRGIQVDLDVTAALSRQAAATSSIILSAIVYERRSWNQLPELFRDKDPKEGWARYVDLITSRSFASLIRLGLLPPREEFANELEETARGSTWIESLDSVALTSLYDELTSRAHKIIEAEDGFALNGLTPSAAVPSTGAWVCASSTGVAEVTAVEGKNVELVTIGASKNDRLRKVRADFVMATGLARSCN